MSEGSTPADLPPPRAEFPPSRLRPPRPRHALLSSRPRRRGALLAASEDASEGVRPERKAGVAGRHHAWGSASYRRDRRRPR